MPPALLHCGDGGVSDRTETKRINLSFIPPEDLMVWEYFLNSLDSWSWSLDWWWLTSGTYTHKISGAQPDWPVDSSCASLRLFIPDFFWFVQTSSSGTNPGCSIFLLFQKDGGHCALKNLQYSGNVFCFFLTSLDLCLSSGGWDRTVLSKPALRFYHGRQS